MAPQNFHPLPSPLSHLDYLLPPAARRPPNNPANMALERLDNGLVTNLASTPLTSVPPYLPVPSPSPACTHCGSLPTSQALATASSNASIPPSHTAPPCIRPPLSNGTQYYPLHAPPPLSPVLYVDVSGPMHVSAYSSTVSVHGHTSMCTVLIVCISTPAVSANIGHCMPAQPSYPPTCINPGLPYLFPFFGPHKVGLMY